MSSPPRITSAVPARVLRPIPVNAEKVKEEFRKLAELYAVHSKDMTAGDSVLFSQYAAKYKENEKQYDNVTGSGRRSSGVSSSGTGGSVTGSSILDQFLRIDHGSVHSAGSARANNFAADMQYYVTEMSNLIEEFLPDRW